LKRTFLSVLILSVVAPLASGADIDLRQLISTGDLDYASPASRSEEGQPIGNGTMGTLVWTTPTQLKFQINRVDVFGEDCSTHSFPERDTDYASGCGFVDIDLADDGSDCLTGPAFNQHLSIYDGQMTIRGDGVSARLVASPKSDFIAIEIEDDRPQPKPIHIDLRMLRYAMQYITGRNYKLVQAHSVEVRTRDQSATSRLDIAGQAIALTQEFREGTFFDSSAVAIQVVGRASRARYLNDSTVELIARPLRGSSRFLSAAARLSIPKRTSRRRRSGSSRRGKQTSPPRPTGGIISGRRASFNSTAPTARPI
jgi:alpha-L-fucosidase 2